MNLANNLSQSQSVFVFMHIADGLCGRSEKRCCSREPEQRDRSCCSFTGFYMTQKLKCLEALSVS
jgi:hypothetical protein